MECTLNVHAPTLPVPNFVGIGHREPFLSLGTFYISPASIRLTDLNNSGIVVMNTISGSTTLLRTILEMLDIVIVFDGLGDSNSRQSEHLNFSSGHSAIDAGAERYERNICFGSS